MNKHLVRMLLGTLVLFVAIIVVAIIAGLGFLISHWPVLMGVLAFIAVTYGIGAFLDIKP